MHLRVFQYGHNKLFVLLALVQVVPVNVRGKGKSTVVGFITDRLTLTYNTK
jgi:hypothetical protein